MNDTETPNVAAMRAIHYTITSSAQHMSDAAQEALEGIAARIGPILAADVGGHGRAAHWRVIAAIALQMEARVMGIDHANYHGYAVGVLDRALAANDKPLTPV